MLEKKQLYAGVCMSTLSPGCVMAFIIADMAGTTPEVYKNHSFFISHPCRWLNQSMEA